MSQTNVIESAAAAMAKLNGLDWHERCAREDDPDNECDSSTCIAAYDEDHDPDNMREWYRDMATAALATTTDETERRNLVSPGTGIIALYRIATTAETERLRDEVERLREALKPFADCCEYIGADEDDEEWARFRLIVSDYRRARAALARTQGETP